jgi:hypothetical protein
MYDISNEIIPIRGSIDILNPLCKKVAKIEARGLKKMFASNDKSIRLYL